VELDEKNIQNIIEEVVKNLDINHIEPHPVGIKMQGIFEDMNSAVYAALKAQRNLTEMSLAIRRKCIQAMRECVINNLEHLSKSARDETGFGKVADKMMKNRLAAEMTPGIEDLQPETYSDDHGLTLTENAPYGVIGAISPSTNPTETIISNAIGMIAGGNSVVFNSHPAAKKVSSLTIHLLNEAIIKSGGPENVICAVENPTIESAEMMMKHPYINLLVVTGGPGVVAAAMKNKKKVIAAGPGNPPVVVDETANLVKAGKDIVNGASFDNNIICICEKEVLVVRSVADKLKEEMIKNGAYEIEKSQIEKLTKNVIVDPGRKGYAGSPNREFVGKDASVIAESIGLRIPEETKILLCEVEKEHPLVWTEQLMPVIPFVRFDNAEDAIDFAFECEHQFMHSASIHSKNIERLSKMARIMNCSLFVKNGSNFNGMAYGGAGYTSFTIASPTGEGFTRARDFTRRRRCSLIDYFRIV